MTPATQSAAELCAVSGLGDEARSLLREGLGPREYFNLLIERGHYNDAVRFLSHALPKREAAWWAWYCARRSLGPNPPAAITAALDATEKWITQPHEAHRRAALKAAQAAQFSTPAGCAALAVFFSGGSVSPPDAPAVPPGPFVSAKAIAGAVMLAAVAPDPQRAPEAFQAFLAQGVEVASRIKLW